MDRNCQYRRFQSFRQLFRYQNAQQEILGLVVIVLIFVVALSFVLFFSLRDTQSTFLEDFDEELHSHNTITALLQTTHPDCRDLSTLTIIEQCAWTNTWQGSACPSLAAPSIALVPCSYAAERIALMLNRSLAEYNFEYRFRMYTEQDIVDGSVTTPRLEIQTSSCTGDVLSSTQPLNYRGGKLFIQLDLCERE